MASSSSACDVLSHIQRVQQTQQLVQTLAVVCNTPRRQQVALDAVRFFFEGSAQDLTKLKQDLSNDEVVVVNLVMEQLERERSGTPSAPEAPSCSVVAGMQAAAFPQATPTRDFFQLLSTQTQRQAEMCQAASIEALAGVLGARTCFAVLKLAQESNCSPLLKAAEGTALTCFEDALLQDSASFAALPVELVHRLLAQDRLQVDNEERVFAAAVKWVEADVINRRPFFRQLLAEVVRLGDMDVEQLGRVDGHSLVLQDHDCTKLVAQAYLSKYLEGGSRTFTRGVLTSPARPEAASPINSRAATADVAMSPVAVPIPNGGSDYYYDPEDEFGDELPPPRSASLPGNSMRAAMLASPTRAACQPPAAAQQQRRQPSWPPAADKPAGGGGTAVAGKRDLFASVTSPTGGRKTPWPPAPAAGGPPAWKGLAGRKKLRFD